MNKQLQTFSFNPPIDLVEEGKWLLAVTSFEATNSVFKITQENNNFSIPSPSHWSSRGGAETFYNLQEIFELRSQNDIEFHVKEIEKRGNKIKVEDQDNKLSDLDTKQKRYMIIQKR